MTNKKTTDKMLEDKQSNGDNMKTSLHSEQEQDGIDAFKCGLLPETILGAIHNNGQVRFIIKFKGVEKHFTIATTYANVMCPQLVIDFYEKRFCWRPIN